MNPLEIYWPFKPFTVTQRWGVLNPAYSEQFNDPSFKRHNGIDAKPYFSDVTFLVYCPVENFKVESVSYEPNGGGNQISLISKEKVIVNGVSCYARIWFCHAKKILVKEGDSLALGQLIMIANNTGYSTGPHTHMGLYRLNDNYGKLDTNEATGSIDPALFFTNKFAVDNATYTTLFTSGLRYYQYLLTNK